MGAGSREAKPGEAGTTEDEMQPGAAEEEEREEAVAGQDLAGQASDTAKATEGGAKPSEVNADEEVVSASDEVETRTAAVGCTAEAARDREQQRGSSKAGAPDLFMVGIHRRVGPSGLRRHERGGSLSR